MMRRAALILLLALAWPMAAAAQFATLIADSVSFGGGDTVIASGNVEILYQGQRVLARRLIYDRAADQVTFEGPLTLIEADGAVMTGDSAILSGDLQQGIVRGARLVLDGQMQLAAVEINRVDGRYNQLTKTVASSCRICANNPTPLWQIRARRVVHDQQERQLYFDDARFEVMGVPVAYFPYLRLPDPTLKRATGFLVPQIVTSTSLGVGLKFPYFLVVNDHADILVTPYLSSNTRTLEGRYRQELSFGSIELEGAVSVDELLPGEPRAYLFGRGRFNLPADFDLNVDVGLVSDTAYLLTYGYDDTDRLASGVELTRTRRNEYISASFQKLRSLRAAEVPIEDTLATLLGRATYERRIFPGAIGGEVRLVFDLEGHERIAETVTPTLLVSCAAAMAPECTARDVLRGGISMGWQRNWTFGNGMVAGVKTDVSSDFYWIGQDATFAPEVSHVTPTAAVELRWPFARTAPNGATDVIQPVVQVAWTDTTGAMVPNEDSKLVEFDEGNLTALSRFPGSDMYERGVRTTLGLSWARFDPRGREYAVTVGRVIRRNDRGQFTAASGLDGGSSDWLVATRVDIDNKLSLSNRSLFDDSFNFAKSETQITWSSKRVSAAGSYIWVVADPAEGRAGDISEINFDAAYRLGRHWTATAEGRYDVNLDKAASAGLGLKYQNECLNVDLSLSRRFTASTTVQPTTDIGLSVSLNGFGRSGLDYARTCQVKG